MSAVFEVVGSNTSPGSSIWVLKTSVDPGLKDV